MSQHGIAARPARSTVRTAPLVTFLAGSLLLSACGTRLDEQEAGDQLRALQGSGGQVVDGQGLAVGETTADTGTTDTGATGGTSEGTAGTTTEGTTTEGTTTGGSTTGGATTQSGTTAPGGTTTAQGGAKAPIVVGMVGVFSGVVGAAYSPARDAAAAWAKTVNAKGGIDGHPVKVLIADNGNNAGNDISIVKRFVEDEGAIALLNYYPATAAAANVAKYAQDKGIAIVGGSGFESEWAKFPSMFPVTTAAAIQDASWANAMKDAGAKVVGSIHCTEGAVCAEKQGNFARAAKELGMTVAYETQGSLAQPDFTSVCTEARSRNVEAFVPILDGNSVLRVARDCNRQGYKPILINPQPGNETPAATEGMIAPITSFPWFLSSGSPALQEYGAAMKKFVPKTNTYSSGGWLSGKLLEKALTGRVADKPAAKDVLAGLYALKGETLGGLSQPLTFAKSAPTVTIPCTWKVIVKGGKWANPDGLKATLCPKVG